MQKIFVSYRRCDDPYAAMSIYDRLKDRFDSKSVFFDVDAIPAGVDFRKFIKAAVEKCDVLLVIIGDNWLAKDSDGIVRITKSDDFVRIEIETALLRKIPIIPILVGNSKIPSAHQLPIEIRDLVYRNAREVRSGSRFQGEVEGLLSSIELLDKSTKTKTKMFLYILLFNIILVFLFSSFYRTNTKDKQGKLTPINIENDRSKLNLTSSDDGKNELAPIDTQSKALSTISKTGIDITYYRDTNKWWTAPYKQLSKVGKSYALVIGVSEYDDVDFMHLTSRNDAFKIKNYLLNEADFDAVRLITDGQVTFEKVRSYMLEYLPEHLGDNDRFLFYWSGHTVTEKGSRQELGYDRYLVLTKSSATQFSKMLNVGSLLTWDRHIHAKNILYIFDACLGRLGSLNQTSFVNQSSKQVLTACAEEQIPISINDLGGSLFTSALLDGLRGRADASQGTFSKDGVITVRELVEYTRARSEHERKRGHWNKPITPMLYNLSQAEEGFKFILNMNKLKKQ